MQSHVETDPSESFLFLLIKIFVDRSMSWDATAPETSFEKPFDRSQRLVSFDKYR